MGVTYLFVDTLHTKRRWSPFRDETRPPGGMGARYSGLYATRASASELADMMSGISRSSYQVGLMVWGDGGKGGLPAKARDCTAPNPPAMAGSR